MMHQETQQRTIKKQTHFFLRHDFSEIQHYTKKARLAAFILPCAVFFVAGGCRTGAMPVAEPRLNIVSARYGADNTWQDVTGTLREKAAAANTDELPVNAATLGIPVNTVTFNEPFYYQAKRLEVKTVLNGRETILKVADGKSLPLRKDLAAGRLFISPEIQRRVEDAYARGDKKITIPPAIYKISDSKAQWFHLEFRDMKDFEIDATGATFIFENKNKCGIWFVNCRNVTFKGATLLRETPTFSQGTIKARGKDYLDIEVHQGYPTDIDRTPVLTFFGIDRIIKKGFAGEANIAKIEKRNKQLIRFYVGDPERLTVGPGDLAAWRLEPQPRLIDGELTVLDCAGMVIRGVTIKNGILGCVKESGGDGGNYYNYTVTYADPPKGATQKPLLASAADGFFSQFTRKGPTLENCLLEGMHDDGVNIHGKIWRIKEIKDNQVTISHCLMPSRKGDIYQFFDAKHTLVCEAKTRSAVKLEPGVLKLTLDRNIPMNCKSALNADECGNGYVIRNTVTRNHRGRGFLVRPDNGIIENCLIEDMNKGGICIFPEFLWGDEGPYARNIIVRNNVILRCAADCYGTGGALSVSSLQSVNWNDPGKGPWAWVPRPGGFRNIVVDGNRFEYCDGPNISISSAAGVTVKNNVFLAPMRNFLKFNATMPEDSLVFVTESDDVTFEANKIEQPGMFMKTPVTVSPTAKVTGAQTGFLLEN